MASTRKRLEELTAGLTLPELPPAAPLPPAQSAEQSHPPAVDNNGVVTRFPPARTGQPLARTGPGQMLAFRGQLQAVEGELVTLRDRLAAHDGAHPTRKLDPAVVHPSRWANRHEASFGSAEFAGLKADIERAGGNVQAILVRPFSDRAGHYEIVFGHRRHRACAELGLPVFAAIWQDPMSDIELFAAMDRENRERADLSPYEQGLMYSKALEEGIFPSQRRLAESLGVSHTWVRKALLVGQLPIAIVACFKNPLQITHRHGEQLQAALDKDSRGLLKRAEKLRGQDLAPNAVVERLVEGQGAPRPAEVNVAVGKKSIGKAFRSKTGGIKIELSASGLASVSQDEALEALRAVFPSLLSGEKTS